MRRKQRVEEVGGMTNLIRRAYQETVDNLLRGGKDKGDENFYAAVAFHLISELRQRNHDDPLSLSVNTAVRYITQRKALENQIAGKYLH